MLTAGRIVFPVIGTHAYWLAIKGGQFGPASALSLMLVPFLLVALLAAVPAVRPAERGGARMNPRPLVDEARPRDAPRARHGLLHLPDLLHARAVAEDRPGGRLRQPAHRREPDPRELRGAVRARGRGPGLRGPRAAPVLSVHRSGWRTPSSSSPARSPSRSRSSVAAAYALGRLRPPGFRWWRRVDLRHVRHPADHPLRPAVSGGERARAGRQPPRPAPDLPDDGPALLRVDAVGLLPAPAAGDRGGRPHRGREPRHRLLSHHPAA